MRRALAPLLLLLLTLPLAGCRAVRTVAAKYPAPDIETVYLPTAETGAHHVERNPLVVIPGFGGSELRDAEGRAVWGARFTDDALSFGKPEGLRALALDVPAGLASLPTGAAVGRLYRPNTATSDELLDDSTVTGPMLFFRTEVVAELEVPVYAGLLRGLAQGGYRLVPEEIAERLNVAKNPEGPPCFVFSYDWRRDLPSGAAELGRFLDEIGEHVAAAHRQRSEAETADPVRFDLLAHSMGGLLTRYYLRYGARDVLPDVSDDPDAPLPEVTWDGARRVDRAVFLSPPNRGTAKAIRNLANGENTFLMPAYEPALVTTWTSVPQMFPPPEPGLLSDASGQALDLDYFDVSVWREQHWGPFRPEQREYLGEIFPEIADPDARIRHVEALLAASLRRGERFVRLMNAPASPPPRTTLHLFTGDADPTLARGIARPRDGRLRLVFDESNREHTEPGDGSVTRRSALADLRPPGSRDWLRSSVPWTSVVFLSDRHAGLLSNRVLHDNLLHLLLETPPPRFAPPQ